AGKQGLAWGSSGVALGELSPRAVVSSCCVARLDTMAPSGHRRPAGTDGARRGREPMTIALPTAEVVRTCIDETFDRHPPVLLLRWQEDVGPAERLWELPEGLCVASAPPSRLGVAIRRQPGGEYAVRLLWERTLLAWPTLSRMELLGSCLGPLLAAL